MNKKNKNIHHSFKKSLLILTFTFVYNISVFSQTSTDSLDYIAISKPINVLSTYLDKRLNTYSLNSGLTVNYDLEDLNFRLFENFNSKFVKSGAKNRRDEQRLVLFASYKILPVLTSGISVDNKILSDDRKIEINQASISSVSLFTLYSPQPGMEFSPFIGYSNNRQIGENDYGLIYGIEGVAEESNISDFNLTSQLKFRNEDISPRRNLIRYLNLLLNNNFADDVSNTISARFTQNRKDFYYTADQQISGEFNIANNIQSRTETGYSVDDSLRFGKFFDIFTLNSRGNVTWREIYMNTRYKPLIIKPNSVYVKKF